MRCYTRGLVHTGIHKHIAPRRVLFQRYRWRVDGWMKDEKGWGTIGGETGWVAPSQPGAPASWVENYSANMSYIPIYQAVRACEAMFWHMLVVFQCTKARARRGFRWSPIAHTLGKSWASWNYILHQKSKWFKNNVLGKHLSRIRFAKLI